MSTELNVLGTELELCCLVPMTGFLRDGRCSAGPEDIGSHTVCGRFDETFPEFSRSVGNDLSTPMPEYGFLGLNPGDNGVCVFLAGYGRIRRGVLYPCISERHMNGHCS